MVAISSSSFGEDLGSKMPPRLMLQTSVKEESQGISVPFADVIGVDPTGKDSKMRFVVAIVEMANEGCVCVCVCVESHT